jgi:hypothetical protein
MIRAWRQPRTAILGLLLALLAVLGTSSLSCWHDAHYHDDVSSPVAVATLDHPASDDRDSDTLLHLAAHALAQWVAATSSPVDAGRPPALALPYTASPVTFVHRRTQTAVLRPPRG